MFKSIFMSFGKFPALELLPAFALQSIRIEDQTFPDIDQTLRGSPCSDAEDVGAAEVVVVAEAFGVVVEASVETATVDATVEVMAACEVGATVGAPEEGASVVHHLHTASVEYSPTTRSSDCESVGGVCGFLTI